MHKGKFVFAQLLEFIDRFEFNRIVRKYEGDRYVKTLLATTACGTDVRPTVS